MKRALTLALILVLVVPATSTAQSSCDGTFHAWHQIPVDSLLLDIDVSGPGDGWAVGESFNIDDGTTDGLVVHFDDADFQTMPVPSDKSLDLQGVAALAPDDVYAVGGTSARHQKGVVFHYDGQTWSPQSVPLPPKSDSHLNSISAVSSTDIWTAGFYYKRDGDQKNLIFHYDGTAWTNVPAPSPRKNYNDILAIDGLDANNAWAAGFKGYSTLMVMSWDGTEWHEVRLPRSIRRHDGNFNAVDVVSPTEQWFFGDGFNSHPIAVHRVGGSFIATDVPNLKGTEAFSDGIATSTEAWAVGEVFEFGTPHARATHWDGSTWTDVAVEGSDTDGTLMDGVASDGAGTIWALSKLAANPGDLDDAIVKECAP